MISILVSFGIEKKCEPEVQPVPRAASFAIIGDIYLRMMRIGCVPAGLYSVLLSMYVVRLI